MKRNLVLFLLVAALVLSLALVACDGTPTGEFTLTMDKATISLEKGEKVDLPYQLTKNGELDTDTPIVVSVSGDAVTYDEATKKITAVKAGKSVLTVTLSGVEGVEAKLTVNVPEYTITISGNDNAVVNLGDEENLTYTVMKDGVKVTDKKVKISVDGDALQFLSTGNRVRFVAVGTGSAKVELESDPTVFAVKNYTVEKSFWSSEHAVSKDLMNITETTVTMPGGVLSTS